eukprot:UC4_evm1s652
MLKEEQPVTFVTEFLNRIYSILVDYFQKVNQKVLTEHTVTVFQVLEEMVDNGFPLTTESNILMEMIRPPSIMGALKDAVSGTKRVRDYLPKGQLTVTSWRRDGAKYGQNELFLDAVEYVDAIVTAQGHTIVSEIIGVINCKCKLSGMPDLTLRFKNPSILDDVALHPCVRLKRWAGEHVMSFIPPDGNFELCNYIVGPQHQVNLPVYINPDIKLSQDGGSILVELGPKQTMGKPVDDITVTIPMPNCVNSVSTDCSPDSVGMKAMFNQVDKVIVWTIKKLGAQPVKLRGRVSTSMGSTEKILGNPTISVDFRVPNLASSGLKVEKLDIANVTYKPFKGIKYMTKAGKFQIRTLHAYRKGLHERYDYEALPSLNRPGVNNQQEENYCQIIDSKATKIYSYYR